MQRHLGINFFRVHIFLHPLIISACSPSSSPSRYQWSQAAFPNMMATRGFPENRADGVKVTNIKLFIILWNSFKNY